MDDDDKDITVEPKLTTPMELPPEEFYNNPDSIYVRVKWDDSEKGFAITVRNELWYKYEEDPSKIPDELVKLSAYVRGMIELGLAFPTRAYAIGVEAVNQDTIFRETEGMSEEQKELLRGEMKGNA